MSRSLYINTRAYIQSIINELEKTTRAAAGALTLIESSRWTRVGRATAAARWRATTAARPER